MSLPSAATSSNLARVQNPLPSTRSSSCYSTADRAQSAGRWGRPLRSPCSLAVGGAISGAELSSGQRPRPALPAGPRGQAEDSDTWRPHGLSDGAAQEERARPGVRQEARRGAGSGGAEPPRRRGRAEGGRRRREGEEQAAGGVHLPRRARELGVRAAVLAAGRGGHHRQLGLLRRRDRPIRAPPARPFCPRVCSASPNPVVRGRRSSRTTPAATTSGRAAT